MNLTVANQKIKSTFSGKTYAEEGDLLFLIEVRGDVGLYYNYYNKERFPALISKVKIVDSRVYIRLETKVETKTKPIKPTNQLSLF